ncbi:hypothetical protein ACJX0J_008541 [Zea mays]
MPTPFIYKKFLLSTCFVLMQFWFARTTCSITRCIGKKKLYKHTLVHALISWNKTKNWLHGLKYIVRKGHITGVVPHVIGTDLKKCTKIGTDVVLDSNFHKGDIFMKIRKMRIILSALLIPFQDSRGPIVWIPIVYHNI